MVHGKFLDPREPSAVPDEKGPQDTPALLNQEGWGRRTDYRKKPKSLPFPNDNDLHDALDWLKSRGVDIDNPDVTSVTTFKKRPETPKSERLC